MNRPSNWHDMSWEERKDWTKTQRELEDERYYQKKQVRELEEVYQNERRNRLKEREERKREREKLALLKEEILKEFEKEFDMYNPIYDDGIKIPVWNKGDFENFKSFLSYSLDRVYQVIEEEKR